MAADTTPAVNELFPIDCEFKARTACKAYLGCLGD